jgi:8-oxo-dGTP pyrophosphatase MutT (NUDIX family)
VSFDAPETGEALRPAAARPHPEGIAQALRDPPPARLPDGECDTRAAVTLLLAPDDDGAVSSLFVLRAARDGDPWSGHVALPGGRSEPSDLDLLDTARRETREETCVEVTRDQFVGRLSEIHPRSVHLPSIGVTPFVAWLPRRPEVRENHELAGHLWVPLHALRAAENRSTLVRPKPVERVFPTIEYAGAVIWGLTLAIVDEFVDRLSRRP